MKIIQRFFMYSCSEATYLIDVNSFKKINLLNRYKLNLHLDNCPVCNSYSQQSKMIDKYLSYINKNPNILQGIFKVDSINLENNIIGIIKKNNF